MVKSSKLSNKQKLFVKEYLVDKNGAKAAVRCGYSEKTARQIAHELLTKPAVKAAIEKSIQKSCDKLDITKEKILLKIDSVIERCMQNEPVFDSKGNPIGEYKFDSRGALKGLELLGKYKKLFTDVVENNVKISHEQLLEELK